MPLSASEVLYRLQSVANPANVAGMARYGINPQGTLGVSMPTLRSLAREIGKNHSLAQELWESGIHEARILAALVDDPKLVTEEQMERWVMDFDSWDVCDQVCSNLFDRTSFAYAQVFTWSGRSEEFVRRAAFTLIAALASHDKKASDSQFEAFLPLIANAATDERNFVKKSVNWALRGIGKRNLHLNARAVETARQLLSSPARAARWVANDALRELTSEKVLERLRQ